METANPAPDDTSQVNSGESEGRGTSVELTEIKSERERMETNGSGLINRSEKRALPIDNRGAYKC